MVNGVRLVGLSLPSDEDWLAIRSTCTLLGIHMGLVAVRRLFFSDADTVFNLVLPRNVPCIAAYLLLWHMRCVSFELFEWEHG